MTTPAWQVDVAFGITPGEPVDPGDWVDISDYVEAFTPETGRKDEWSGFSAGTMQVTLANSSGRFDPQCATGPHFGDLKPLVPVRLTAGVSSADTDVFYGVVSIQGWQVVPRPPADSVTLIRVVDLFDILAATDAPSSPWAVEVAYDEPDNWWRADEGVDATVARDIGSSPSDGSYASPGVLGATSPVRNETSTALQVTPSVSAVLPTSPRPLDMSGAVPAGDFHISFALDWDGTTDGIVPLVMADATGAPATRTTMQVMFGNDGSRYAQIVFNVSGVTNASAKARPSASGGNTGIVALRREGDVWTLSGATANTTTGDLIGYGEVTVTQAFTPTLMFVGSYSTTGTGTFRVADYALWNTIPSSARRSIHLYAGVEAWAGDLPGERLARIRQAAGISAALTVFSTGSSVMPSATLGGDLLSLMQATAAADRGRLYIDHRAGGVVRFADRNAVPSTGVELLSAEQSGAEAGITGWAAAYNTTVARSTSQAYEGSASLRLTATAADDMYASTPSGASGIPIDPGRDINVYVRSRAAATARTFRVLVNFDGSSPFSTSPGSVPYYYADGDFGPAAVNTTSGWTLARFTIPAPYPDYPDIRFLQLAVGVVGCGASEQHYFDGMSVTQGNVDPTTGDAVLVTLGDSGSEVPYAAISLADDRIVNRMTVSRSGGATAVAFDAASIAEYRVRAGSETGLLFATDTEALDRAEYVVAEKSTLRRACTEVVLEPRAAGHDAWPWVFALTITDRVEVKYRPTYGGTQTYECIVEGIRHEWTQAGQAWRTTLSLSPAPASTTTY